MTRSEYERRRRALEAQLAADVELVRAAHETRMRALESLWLAEGEEDAVSAPPSGEADSAQPVPIGTQTGTQSGTQSGTQTGTQTPPAVAGAVRKAYGEVAGDVEDAFPRLPEVFDKEVLLRELGYQPPRSTFYRALQGLLMEKKIVIVSHSDGRARTKYRKVGGQEI